MFAELTAALPKRLASKLMQDSASDCILWAGCTNWRGYGKYWDRGSVRQAHRVVWELWHKQALANDLCLDHTCRRRLCCNPLHLEPVTNAENVRRGLSTLTCEHGVRPKHRCARCLREQKRNHRAKGQAVQYSDRHLSQVVVANPDSASGYISDAGGSSSVLAHE